MFAPTTELRLLQNIDITKDYDNSFRFSSESVQASFFLSKTKNVFSDFDFMRKNNSVKVDANVESLFSVSYLMFKNKDFSNKWFYGFVTDLIYVNDATTEVIFEIDVIQTWLFDMDIKQCMVEREHVSDDTAGKHILAEGLTLGEIVSNAIIEDTEFTETVYVLATTNTVSSGVVSQAQGKEQHQIYSGCAYVYFDTATALSLYLIVLANAGVIDGVSSIFLYPKGLLSAYSDGNIIDEQFPTINNWIECNSLKVSSLDGYSPVNNKLKTYPYKYLYVTNKVGMTADFLYENFTSDIDFKVNAQLAPATTIHYTPMNYNGLSSDNKDESISSTPLPLATWLNDIYSSWLAQNSVSRRAQIMSTNIGLAGSAIDLSASGVVSGVEKHLSLYATKKDKQVVPNSLQGSTSLTAFFGESGWTCDFHDKSIKSEVAKTIDDFFTMFGYKVAVLKTPQFTSRLNWNYIKTVGANIFGNVPNNDLVKIRSIFDRGLTFWHNDNVGNYGRSNGIV